MPIASNRRPFFNAALSAENDNRILATNRVTATVAAPVNTVRPAVTGTRRVGQTLTCSTGTWDNTPTGYAYQWLRYGAEISGATNSTYTPTTADADQAINCQVTASNAGGSTAATSAYDARTIPRAFDWTGASNTSYSAAGATGTSSVGVNGWLSMKANCWRIQSGYAEGATISGGFGYRQDMLYFPNRLRLNDRVAVQGGNQGANYNYPVGLGYNPTTGQGYMVTWNQAGRSIAVRRLLSATSTYPATTEILPLSTALSATTYASGASTDWCVIERTVFGETSVLTITICPDAGNYPDYANPRLTWTTYDTFAPTAAPGYAFVAAYSSVATPTRIPRFEFTSATFDITSASVRYGLSQTLDIVLTGINTVWAADSVFTLSSGATLNSMTYASATSVTLNVTTGSTETDVTITDPHGFTQRAYLRGTPSAETRQIYGSARLTRTAKVPPANGIGSATFVSGAGHYGVGFSADGQYVYVCNQTNVLKYNLAGTLQSTITYTGLSGVRKMVTLPDGSLVFCNYGASTYSLLNSSDVYQRQWNTTATTNTYGLCVFYDQALGRNTVLTAGWANSDIKQWELDGTYIGLWASAVGGSIADVAAGADGKVYAVDWTNGRLIKFNNNGTGKAIIATTMSKPHGIGILRDGTILIACETDSYANRIRAFTPSGNELGDYQANGTSVDVKVIPF